MRALNSAEICKFVRETESQYEEFPEKVRVFFETDEITSEIASKLLSHVKLKKSLEILIQGGLDINSTIFPIFFDLFDQEIQETEVRRKIGWLLELGLDPYLTDWDGNTIMHKSAHSGFAALARDLKDRRLCPLVYNSADMSPSEVAYGNPVGEFFKNWEYEVANTWR